MRFSVYLSSARFIFLMSLLGLLASCGGDEENNFGEVDVPDARLSSFSFSQVDIDFDPERSGVYVAEVDNSVQSISFTATTDTTNTLTYTLQRSSAATIRDREFQSGVAVDIELNEGSNVLSVVVSTPDSSVLVTYNFSILRVSATANVQSVTFQNLVSNNTPIELTPAFSPDVLSYTATLDAQSCVVRAQNLIANNIRTGLTVNGRSFRSGDSPIIPIDVGSNTVEIIATSQDGSTTQNYSFELTRPALTQEQLDASSLLTGITISGSEFDFNCAQGTVFASVNADNPTPSITLTPESSDAVLSILEVVDAQPTNEQPVDAGSAFPLTLETGENQYVVRVDPLDESAASRDYNLSITLRTNNVINVSTSAELQAALLDAQPNDEIRLLANSFDALAPDATGGSNFAAAHFYSNASGTQEQPITLIGGLPNNGVVLAGTSTDALALLQLEGDYWNILNITFSNARTGIVLDNASNNTLVGLGFDNIGENGIVVRNQSDNNTINSSQFSNIGVALDGEARANADAIVIGSDSTQWTAASGGSGDVEPANIGNSVRNNMFASDLTAQSIEVNEGALNTLIEFNRFSTGGLSDATDSGSLIRIQGNNTIIRFNQFEHDSDPNAQALISVAPASLPNLEQMWGMNTQVHNNVLNLNGSNIFAIQAGDQNVVQAVRNNRLDEMMTQYSGAMVNSTSFSAPFFAIKWSSDMSMCVGLGEGDEEFISLLSECNSEENQQWQFVLDELGFVQITNRARPGLFLRPRLGFTNPAPGTNTLPSLSPLIMSESSDGFLQQWRPSFFSDSIVLRNRQNFQYAISVFGSFVDGVDPLILVSNNQPQQNILFVIEQVE